MSGRETETAHCPEHGEYQAAVLVLRGERRVAICPDCIDLELRGECEAIARQRMANGRRQLVELLGHAGIPPRFLRRGFDTFRATSEQQREALTQARAYAQQFDRHRRDGEGLVMIGRPGTGKTHLATAICKAVIRAGWSACFTSTLGMLQAVKASYRRDSELTERDVITRFAEPDLLALDEVGVQHHTQAERVVLTDLVNRRYEHLRPTILLGNLTVTELEEALGQRVMRRVRETSSVIVFDWEAHRGGA